MRKEAGAGDVFAGGVDGDAVGLADVGLDGAEPVEVGVFGKVDGDNPFEAVATGAAEEEEGFEGRVLQECLEGVFYGRQVVEVQAEKAGMGDEAAFAAGGEEAGEGAEVEAAALEGGLGLFVG